MTHRSWLRWTVRVLLVLVVLLLGTALVVRVYGQHRLAQARRLADQVFAGLTLERCAPPRAAAAEDPAPLLRAGAVAWSASEDDVDFLGRLSARPSSSWSEEERRRARSLLALETTALELLHRAGERGAPAASLLQGLAGEAGDRTLIGYMRSSRILAVHSQLAWQAGEQRQARHSHAALAQLSASLQHSNTIIGLLIGGAGEKLLHAAVQPIVEDPATPADDLARIAALVPAEDLSQRWRCVLLREQADLKQAVAQRMSSGDTLSHWPVPDITGPLLEAQLLAFYARLAGATDEPFGGQPAWSAPPSLWRDGVIAGITAPNLISGVARLQHLAASRQLLHTAIALRLHALTSGAYPLTVSTVPGANRPDPFTGEPHHYALEGDGSVTLSSPRMAELFSDRRVASRISSSAPTAWHLPPPEPSRRGAAAPRVSPPHPLTAPPARE